MRLLLDTHALLWWLTDDSRLSSAAYRAIEDASNDVLVSAASAWEIAIKYQSGKLPEARPVTNDLASLLLLEGFEPLPITVDDGLRAGALPGHHHDPFDRMLIAQAISHNLTLNSNETIFDSYGVRRLW